MRRNTNLPAAHFEKSNAIERQRKPSSRVLIVYGVPNGIAGPIEAGWRRPHGEGDGGGVVRRLAALVRRPAA